MSHDRWALHLLRVFFLQKTMQRRVWTRLSSVCSHQKCYQVDYPIKLSGIFVRFEFDLQRWEWVSGATISSPRSSGNNAPQEGGIYKSRWWNYETMKRIWGYLLRIRGGRRWGFNQISVKDYNLSGEVGIQDVLWHDRTCRSGLCTIQMQDVRHTTACRLVTVLKTEDRIR